MTATADIAKEEQFTHAHTLTQTKTDWIKTMTTLAFFCIHLLRFALRFPRFVVGRQSFILSSLHLALCACLEAIGGVLVEAGLVEAGGQSLGVNLPALDVDPHPRLHVQDGGVGTERLALWHQPGHKGLVDTKHRKRMPHNSHEKVRQSSLDSHLKRARCAQTDPSSNRKTAAQAKETLTHFCPLFPQANTATDRH